MVSQILKALENRLCSHMDLLMPNTLSDYAIVFSFLQTSVFSSTKIVICLINDFCMEYLCIIKFGNRSIVLKEFALDTEPFNITFSWARHDKVIFIPSLI